MLKILRKRNGSLRTHNSFVDPLKNIKKDVAIKFDTSKKQFPLIPEEDNKLPNGFNKEKGIVSDIPLFAKKV